MPYEEDVGGSSPSASTSVYATLDTFRPALGLERRGLAGRRADVADDAAESDGGTAALRRARASASRAAIISLPLAGKRSSGTAPNRLARRIRNAS